MARTPRIGSLAGIVGAVAAVLVLIVVLSAVHLLPQLRNPFAETTTVRSQPVILKSITQLSRYEAASGSFEVVVDLTKRTSLLPSFLAGSETLFVGQGTDIAYVDFSGLKSQAITVNANRTTVTVALPKAPLEPAVLNVSQSYVFRIWAVVIGTAVAAALVVLAVALLPGHSSAAPATTTGPPASTSAPASPATSGTPATPASPVAPARPVTPVQPSAAVMQLQRELGQLNYYEGPVDGIMGPQTVQAIQDLQRQAGLPQTGQMNAATQAALAGFLAHGNNQMGGNS